MSKNPAKTTAPAAAAPERMFYSDSGEPIRITLPDGAVAIVDQKPRTLPARFHRAAQRAGCIVTGAAKPEVFTTKTQDDPHERQAKIVAAITQAIEEEPDEGASDDVHAAYNAKFEGAFNNDGTPNVRWIEKTVGFDISSQERDQAWATVQAELGLGDDDDDLDEGESFNAD